MSRRPDTATLLGAVRQALLDEVAPALSGGKKYRALMAANAIAIALRDLGGSGSRDETELGLFERLYGAEQVEAAGEDAAARLAVLNRRLCTEIRGGDWDESSQLLIDLLLHQVRVQLARSNPKYLKRLPEG